MGQYYKPINIDNNQWLISYDYRANKWPIGLKLMEHSWMKNPFVKTVESLLAEGGKWFANRIVWAGDYADEEPDGENFYCKVSGRKKIIPEKSNTHYRYIVNLDDWEYVDKNKVPEDKDGWRIHPLPLLTCEGNGRGGGDFHGEDPNHLIGRWARKRIMVQKTLPKNMKEIIFDLTE